MDRQELWQRLARRPNSVRFSELVQLLEHSGFVLHTTRGSHHTYKRDHQRITIPFRRPHVLPVFVKQVLQLTREEADDDN